MDKSGCSIYPMHLCIRIEPLNPTESPLYSTRIKSRSSFSPIHVLLSHSTILTFLYTPFKPLHSILYLLQFAKSYNSFVKMSILAKHQLGVSSPLPLSHTISETPKPLSRDLEDLESLIRSLADELERAEDQKAMQKSDSSTGTGSPDLLATPTTTSNSPKSDMAEDLVTPPTKSRRDGDHSKSVPREGRGSDEKARHARTREKERSVVSASTGSEGKRTRSEKLRREKADDKSSSQPPFDEKARATRTRSRREGLDGSSDKKRETVKRTEIQTFIRIALLCKLYGIFEWANELIVRPSPSSNNDTLYRPRTLHDPNHPHSAVQLSPPLSTPTYRLLHLPCTPRHHLLALNISFLTP